MALEGRSVQRTMVIEGLVLPAIIHNMSYFFVNLPVYADGLVDAWGLLDRPLWEKKLSTGWVTTAVPDGEEIRVHGLGAWTVEEGIWDLTPREMAQLVQECVRTLNPELRNLHDCHGQTTKKVGKFNVSILGSSDPKPMRRLGESPLSRPARGGGSFSVFTREADGVYLADLRVFDGETVEIGRVPDPRVMSRERFEDEVSDGRLLTCPNHGERITIQGLGAFTAGVESWSATAAELRQEVIDAFAQLAGRPTTLETCRGAYEAFLERPTSANREALREAYEAVPEHNRRYLGDMDVNDVPIRMILEGDDEVETWSHRIVAREQGEPDLPTIVVPVIEESDES